MFIVNNFRQGWGGVKNVCTAFMESPRPHMYEVRSDSWRVETDVFFLVTALYSEVDACYAFKSIYIYTREQ